MKARMFQRGKNCKKKKKKKVQSLLLETQHSIKESIQRSNLFKSEARQKYTIREKEYELLL